MTKRHLGKELTSSAMTSMVSWLGHDVLTGECPSYSFFKVKVLNYFRYQSTEKAEIIARRHSASVIGFQGTRCYN